MARTWQILPTPPSSSPEATTRRPPRRSTLRGCSWPAILCSARPAPPSTRSPEPEPTEAPRICGLTAAPQVRALRAALHDLPRASPDLAPSEVAALAVAVNPDRLRSSVPPRPLVIRSAADLSEAARRITAMLHDRGGRVALRDITIVAAALAHGATHPVDLLQDSDRATGHPQLSMWSTSHRLIEGRVGCPRLGPLPGQRPSGCSPRASASGQRRALGSEGTGGASCAGTKRAPCPRWSMSRPRAGCSEWVGDLRTSWCAPAGGPRRCSDSGARSRYRHLHCYGLSKISFYFVFFVVRFFFFYFFFFLFCF